MSLYRVRLLAEAVRWRAASSAALLLIAVAAGFTSAFGPIYSHAADESIIRNTVSNAPVSARGLTLVANLPAEAGSGLPAQQRAQQAAQTAERIGLGQWFASPIFTESISVTLPPTVAEPSGFATELAFRADVCRHLTLVSGACPTQSNDVILSDRSATALGVSVGSRLAYHFSGKLGSPLRLVGTYRATDDSDSYWFDRQFSTYAPPSSGRGNTSFMLDAFFTSPSTIEGLGYLAFPFVTDEMALIVPHVNDSTLAALQQRIADFSLAAANDDQVSVQSLLPTMIRQLTDQQQEMATIVAVATLQLLLLDLLLLFDIVSTSAEIREHDVAMARLRGHSFVGVVAVGLLEPVAILTAGFPIGALLAWLALQYVSQSVLVSGTPVVIDWTTGGAVLLALLGGAVATAFATRRLLLRSLHDQLRSVSTAGATPSRWVASIEAVAIVLALAGVVELTVAGVLRGGATDPLALISPGLLAIAVTLIGIRLIRFAARMVVLRTVLHSRAGALLVARRLLRLPAASRRMLIPALALGLAVFDLAAYSVADNNRAELAAFEVGADRVLIVHAPQGADFLKAVQAADPAAMAAVQYNFAGGSLLGVDASRFPTVAAWLPRVSGGDASAIAAWLGGQGDPNKIHAVITPDQVSLNGSGGTASIHAEGLDRAALSLDGRVEATAIPRLGSSGVMVGLAALEAVSHGTTQDVEEEVWLAGTAAPGIERRLAAAGISVDHVDSASATKKQLDSQGLSLAYYLMLIGVLACAIVAVGATIFSASVDARQRSFEIAALRASGWDSASVLRAVGLELLVIAVASCAVGLLSGAVGAALTLPSVPELTDSTWAVPLDFSLPGTGIAVLAAGFFVLLVVAASAASAAAIRSERALRRVA